MVCPIPVIGLRGPRDYVRVMQIRRLAWSFLSLPLLACGLPDGQGPTAGPPQDAVPAGFERFVTEAVTVPPGTSGEWLQWVMAPLDHDVNIVDVIGKQGPGGHHAIFYATTDVQPVGFAREWLKTDQITSRFLGGIGGEGGDPVMLPKGAVFRLHAGEALAVQTHYLNTTPRPIEGTAELDALFGEPDPTDQVASILGSLNSSFEIPPRGTLRQESRCTLHKDASVLMFANHMHEWGKRITTRLEGPNGTTVLKDDPVWEAEWSSNPNFELRSVEDPLVLTAGTTIVTECEWENDETYPLTYPAEMCAFVSFYLGDHDSGCLNGMSTDPVTSL
jgi:hypothetical protein